MWIDKLAAGVLRVNTPVGPRYIELTFRQRVFFLWIFRHFDKVPQQVLSNREQQVIDALCVEHRFISLPSTARAPIIGTLERLPIPRVEDIPSKLPAATATEAGAVPRFVADLRQRS